LIRRHRPEVVVSINFRGTWGGSYWNHADHRAVGLGLIDAVRDAANRWVFPNLLESGLEPWDGVRFIAFGASPNPTHAVDVTETLERGIESLICHATYLAALGQDPKADEPGAFLRDAARATGPALGVESAVAFEVVPA
jgi:LmbE family N-acetylglucosaminyl deacetylase